MWTIAYECSVGIHVLPLLFVKYMARGVGGGVVDAFISVPARRLDLFLQMYVSQGDVLL